MKEEALEHSVENSLWNRLWTFRKTDYVMNDLTALSIILVTDEQMSLENPWNDPDGGGT